MVLENIVDFSFSSWYPTFKFITFPSKIIRLPDEAIAYLKEDGLTLPCGIDEVPPPDEGKGSSTDYSDSAVSYIHEQHTPWVDSLKRRVNSAIMELGGEVFPKLNWSAPKDARWNSLNRQLKCSSLMEIFSCLKASTFINHDLSDAVQEHGPVRIELILRTWMEINPGWEFRCFVKNGELIGISQRYTGTYYSFISSDRFSLVENILTFYEEKIEGVFPASNFVFDIVTFGLSWQNFCIIDFNPFDRITDSCLFTWEELEDAENVPDDEVFRFVTSPVAVRTDEMRQYEIPVDFLMPSFSTKGKDVFTFLQDKIEEDVSSDESLD